MSSKHISTKSYLWGHVAVITFESIFYVLILYYAYKIYRAIKSNFAKYIMILTGILLVVTLLSLVPILKKYDEIIIN